MTKNLATMLFGLSLLAMAPPAPAQTFDGSKTLLCATMEAVHCDSSGTCAAGSAESINFPEFFRIDFGAKSIVSTRSDGSERKTSIDAQTKSDAGILMHGAQAELAWSMILSPAGKMTLTVSGDREGFMIFGACTNP